MITAKVELGLSAQRIYQDLVGENGFTDSYQSVKRFVRKLRTAQPERIWRLECQPGEELQHAKRSALLYKDPIPPRS